MNPSRTDFTSHLQGQVLKQGCTENPRELWRSLDAMAQLLRQAARVVWARTDQDGPTSPLCSLGLGIHLAHGQTQLLIPEDFVDDETDHELNFHEVGVRTVVQLLTEVEELSRPLSVWRADPGYGSRLVVDVCDLLREARHLDC